MLFSREDILCTIKQLEVDLEVTRRNMAIVAPDILVTRNIFGSYNWPQ